MFRETCSCAFLLFENILGNQVISATNRTLPDRYGVERGKEHFSQPDERRCDE